MDLNDVSYEKCKEMVRRSLQYSRHPLEEIIPDFFEKEQFDKNKKCLLVKRGDLTILVVCLEHSDKWQTILETELDFKGIALSVHNRTIDKKIGRMYSDFKTTLSLPDYIIRKTYLSLNIPILE